LDAFQKIYGVGPAKATDLTKQGFRTIAELRQAIQANPKLLNDKQVVGLKYYEELLERIPHEEMKEHRGVLHRCMQQTVDIRGVELVGSFRRGLATSGDIDVLIRVPEGTPAKAVKEQLAEMVKKMKEAGYIEEVLALGEHKCMAICRLGETGKARRLDLLMTPEEEYAYAILYFTGSDRFNVAFRQYTLEKGYTLNEHTMKPLKNAVGTEIRSAVPRMRTEKDIFRFLGLRYVEPTDRIDGKQIQRVKKPEMGSQ
jgi:DNA polymerase/3'-5' exonuclease PolX